MEESDLPEEVCPSEQIRSSGRRFEAKNGLVPEEVRSPEQLHFSEQGLKERSREVSEQVRPPEQDHIPEPLMAAWLQPHTVYQFLTPVYPNSGDLAVALAAEEYRRREDPPGAIESYTEEETREQLAEIVRHIKPEDHIDLMGGGNFGSLYPRTELLREWAIRTLRGAVDNPITILPQSICFEDTPEGREMLRRSIPVYNDPQVRIIARDQQSEKRAREYYPDASVFLMPDIVFTLRTPQRIRSRTRDVLRCVRSDKESMLPDHGEKLFHEVQALAGAPRSSGALAGALPLPSDVNNPQGNSLRPTLQETAYDPLPSQAENIHFIPIDTCLSMPVPQNERTQSVNAMLQCFESAGAVVTDRLHGLIFAFITGTPAVVLPSYDNKTRGTYEWLKGCTSVCYLEHPTAETILAALGKVRAHDRHRADTLRELRGMWHETAL